MIKIKTKQKILNLALELFNSQGIEYIGTRDIAEAMKLDQGYVTGHFSKKGDLVNAIAWQFSEKNNLLWQSKEEINIKTFFELLKTHFQQQLEYRCLFINFANLQTHYPEIALRNKKEEEMRKKVIRESISAMTKIGELKKIPSKEIDLLTAHILLLIKFWISEAVISHPFADDDEKINYFLKITGLLLMPYTTENGKKIIVRLTK